MGSGLGRPCAAHSPRVTRTVLTVAALVGLACPDRPGLAQPCTVTSTVQAPRGTPVTYPGSIGFEVAVAKSGACCDVRPRWTFSDNGSTSSLYSLSHFYSTPGVHTWTHQASHSCAPNPIGNVTSGQVVVVPESCTVAVTASAEVLDATLRRVRFTANAVATGCGTERPIYYRWDHGDGSSSTTSLSTEDEHYYIREGEFFWSMRAYFGDPQSYVYGSKAGWVKVGCTGRRVGSICFTADSVVQVGDLHTLTGNVRANDLLQFVGHPVVLSGDLATGTADLTTDADLVVATAGKLGPVTISRGAGQNYLVLGTAAPPELRPQLLVPPAPLGFTLNQIPLYWAPDKGLQIAGGVRVPALLYVGRAGGFHLGSLAIGLDLAPGAGVALTPDGTILSGAAAGWVTLEEIHDLTYDPATDVLSGDLTLAYPHLDLRQPAGADRPRYPIEVEAGCLNTLAWQPTVPAGGEPWIAALRPGDRPQLRLAGVVLGDICSASPLALFTGTMTQQVAGKAPRNLEVPDSVWSYIPPSTLTLARASQASLVEETLSRTTGHLAKNGGTDSLFLVGDLHVGAPGSGDIVSGELRLGTLTGPVDSSWTAVGSVKGTFTLEETCACPEKSGDTCRLVRAAFFSSFGPGWQFPDTLFDLGASGSLFDGEGAVVLQAPGLRWGDQSAPVAVAVRWMYLPAEVDDDLDEFDRSCTFGTNLVKRPVPPAAVAGALRAAAQSATFAEAEEPAVFGCIGTSGVLPQLLVTGSNGWLITPKTASSYPGVTYGVDQESKAASVLIASAPPGTWTLEVDNLGEGEASCSILTVQPPPVVAFTRVDPVGETVSLEVSVVPPAESTKVSLYYSTSDDGIPEGEIAADLPAAGGAVTAVWNTADVTSGSYFVFARTDDGLNPPITTVHRPPVNVLNGALQPPSGLAATRTGDTATLTWTASLSPGVAGYTVRYTAEPDTPGYRFSATAPLASGATVSGLDPRKPYRFCVVGYALDGALSPCSASVVLAPTIRVRRVVPH